MKNFYISALCLFVLLTFGSSMGIAQKAPTPEKLALIKEILEVTEVKKSAAETSDLILGMQAAETEKLVRSMIEDDKTLSPEMKEELRKTIDDTSARMNQRTREFFSKRLNFGEMVEEIVITIYDKYFSEKELTDLIAFYRTPTGKRLIQVTPQLTVDIMSGTMEKMTPKLQEFLREVVDSELKVLREVNPVN